MLIWKTLRKLEGLVFLFLSFYFSQLILKNIEEIGNQLGPRIAGSGSGATGNIKNKLKNKSLEFIFCLFANFPT